MDPLRYPACLRPSPRTYPGYVCLTKRTILFDDRVADHIASFERFGKPEVTYWGNEMHQAIEIFAVINFLIIGLSHVFQHRVWAEFFILLHRQGRPGALANGFLSLITGSLIVAFHNVWSGIQVILTVLGWSFVLKAAVVFLVPEWGLRSMARVRPDNSRIFWVPGILMIAVAAMLSYSLWQRFIEAA